MATIGEIIKLERNNLALTQVDLANKLHIASQTVNGWEGNRRLPDIETLKKLAEIFNCSIDYLAGITQNRNPYTLQELIEINDKIEIDEKLLSSYTINDAKELLQKLKDVGFDIKKLL